MVNQLSVQFSCSVVSDSLRPHELQHARPPCPSPTTGDHPTHVHWLGDAIQTSHPLSSPSLLAFNLSQHQRLFPMSQFFSSGGQSIGASASGSVLPMNIQDWFPLGWTGWTPESNQTLRVQGTLKSLLQHHSSNSSILCIRWPEYWSFSFRISPSNEYSGLISFRIGWFDLLAVQGTLRSVADHDVII